MNKKEFYRQLMETYTVDTEKIKCGAKRRALKKNTSSIGKWVISAAACTAAAVAVVSLCVNLAPNPGINITEEGLDTAIERVYAAEQRFKELSATYDIMDMYVSFEEEYKLNEILMSFSSIDDNNDIKLTLLYTSTGKYYKYDDAVRAEVSFRGAKITAPAKLYEELNRLKTVALAEPVEGSKYTDKSFVPYAKKKDPSIIFTTPDEIIITTPEAPVTENTTASETDPDITTSDSQTSVQEPVAAIDIPLTDVKFAQFISNEKLVVGTSDSVRLYNLAEGVLQLETTFYAENAKIDCIASNGAVLYITACDLNGRNLLYLADGAGGTLSEIIITAITAGNNEISSVFSVNNGTGMIFKTVSPEKAVVYYATISENNIDIGFSKEYTSPVSVISYSGGIIYAAVTDTENAAVKICAVSIADGSETELAAYSENVKYFRNNKMDAASLAVEQQDGTVKYFILTPQGTLIETEENPLFSNIDGSVLKIGEKCFRLADGALTELKEDFEQYFAESEYPYSYIADIGEEGTAKLIPAGDHT